jgi:hypothetical protein
MASHAREGHRAEGGRRVHDSVAPPSPAGAPSQSPLDFALAFMRDASKSDALRVSVAKAALPYVHGRWCQVGPDPHDAKPKLPPPFDLPDPFGSLRVEWRDAIERAGLAPAVSAHEPARAVHDKAHEDSLIRHGRTCCGHPRLGRHSKEDVDGRDEPGHDENRELTVAPDAHDAPAQRADSEERARALEQRATLAEGWLREAQHHARDMEQRALAAEALIAGARERW